MLNHKLSDSHELECRNVIMDERFTFLRQREGSMELPLKKIQVGDVSLT